MVLRLYLMRLKCILKNKENMFWSYLFPLLLGTCFYFAFNNMFVTEEFETISVAYISENQSNTGLRTAMETAKSSEDMPMFTIIDESREGAKQLLEEKEITAYIVDGEPIELFVESSGLSQTIMKSFLDYYQRISYSIQTILENNPKAVEEGLLEDMVRDESYVVAPDNSKKGSVILIYMYGLIAYTCIFASSYGLDEVVNIQADQSIKGARINVSPVNKMKLFFGNMLAAMTVHLGSVALLFLYMLYVFKIEFGGNLFYVALVCVIGSLVGMIIGAVVGIYVKKSYDVKAAIVTSITLVGSFLSGMMIANVKMLIRTKAPMIQYLNPVGLISDTLFSLSYYETYERYFLYLGIMVVFILVMGSIAFLGLRRKTYASI